MRILLDECLPRQLKGMLVPHSCAAVDDMGWKGIANGRLLALAAAQFDILLTSDRSLPSQQSLAALRVAILVVPTNNRRELVGMSAQIMNALPRASPGTALFLRRDGSLGDSPP